MSDFTVTCAESGCGLTFEATSKEYLDEIFREHQQQAHNFMTGQAFYERFVDAYNAAGIRKIAGDAYHDEAIMEAAKRAAGLK